ncbi:MAG: hypothetical protein EBU90_03140 [Proteobacteria bacterium]|nr:hypothetical protein [Pseudomonadota bacterium]NBP13321.1 hypothetical protein [bacterium]
MCGIFGARELERYLELYDLNRKRGTFATSLCVLTTQGDLVVHRWSGSITKKEAEKELVNSLKILEQKTQVPCEAKFYLGHTQAPTSAKRKYSRDTAHPFSFSEWVVAHNGVLTNFKDIKENFDPKWPNPVDSSIIPFMVAAMLDTLGHKYDHTDILCQTLGLLQGTFGLWLFNANNRNIYLARCGSTVFINALQNEFSSVEFKDSEPLPEGHLFQITPEGITAIGMFDCDSPFFA